MHSRRPEDEEPAYEVCFSDAHNSGGSHHQLCDFAISLNWHAFWLSASLMRADCNDQQTSLSPLSVQQKADKNSAGECLSGIVHAQRYGDMSTPAYCDFRHEFHSHNLPVLLLKAETLSICHAEHRSAPLFPPQLPCLRQQPTIRRTLPAPPTTKNSVSRWPAMKLTLPKKDTASTSTRTESAFWWSGLSRKSGVLSARRTCSCCPSSLVSLLDASLLMKLSPKANCRCCFNSSFLFFQHGQRCGQLHHLAWYSF